MSTELAILTQIKKNQAKGDLFSYSTDTTLPVEYEDKEINIIPEASDLTLKLPNLSDGMNKLKLKNISDIDAYILDNSEELLTIIKSQGKIDLHVNNGEFYSSNSEKLHDNLLKENNFPEYIGYNPSITVLSETKAIICYKGTSNYGYACILNISGETITPGTPFIFDKKSGIDNYKAVALSEDRVVVCYYYYNSYYRGYFSYLGISGDDIIMRNQGYFDSGEINYSNISVAALSDTKAIVCYKDGNTNYLNFKTLYLLSTNLNYLRVGAEFNIPNNHQYSSITALSETKAIVCYQDLSDSSDGTACILNIPDDETITSGTPVKFETITNNINSISMLSETKAIVCYRGPGNYCMSRILDISGETITPGNSYNFDDGNVYPEYIDIIGLSETKAVISYWLLNDNYPKICILNILGSIITPENPLHVNSEDTSNRLGINKLSKYKPILFYYDGSSIVFRLVNLSKFNSPFGSVIKSIQYGKISATSATSVHTVNISSVDIKKSVLHILGSNTSGNYFIEFQDSATIRIQLYTAVAGTISFCVVEYN